MRWNHETSLSGGLHRKQAEMETSEKDSDEECSQDDLLWGQGSKRSGAVAQSQALAGPAGTPEQTAWRVDVSWNRAFTARHPITDAGALHGFANSLQLRSGQPQRETALSTQSPMLSGAGRISAHPDGHLGSDEGLLLLPPKFCISFGFQAQQQQKICGKNTYCKISFRSS